MVEEYYLEAIHNSRTKLILRLEETIVLETHNFFQRKGLTSLLLPVTTGSISSPMGLGSDSVPVTIHLNGHKTYLADSMQFLLEYGCRIFPDGCYYVMPTFRGEDIDDRHLKQFFHSEAEIPGKLDDVKTLVEEYLKHLMDVILCKYDYELEQGNGVSHIKKFIANSIPTVTFEQAVDFFSGNYAENFSLYVEVSDGYRNITKAGERELIKANGVLYGYRILTKWRCHSIKKQTAIQL